MPASVKVAWPPHASFSVKKVWLLCVSHREAASITVKEAWPLHPLQSIRSDFFLCSFRIFLAAV